MVKFQFLGCLIQKNPATIKHKIDNGMAFDISLLIMLRYDF